MKIEFGKDGKPTHVLTVTEKRQLLKARDILLKVGVINEDAKEAAMACDAFAAGESHVKPESR